MNCSGERNSQQSSIHNVSIKTNRKKKSAKQQPQVEAVDKISEKLVLGDAS